MKISDHQYSDEFLREVNFFEFGEWVLRNLGGFVENLSMQKNGDFPKYLHEWISWFLAWSEYSDFMEWKREQEKDG